MINDLCNTTEQETKKPNTCSMSTIQTKTFVKLTTKPQHIFVTDAEPVPRTSVLTDLSKDLNAYSTITKPYQEKKNFCTSLEISKCFSA